MSSSREHRKAQWLEDYEVLVEKILSLNVDAKTQKQLQSDLDKLHAHILTCETNSGYYKDILDGFNQLNAVLETPKKTLPTAVQRSSSPQLIPRLRQQPPATVNQPKSASKLEGCLTFFYCIAKTTSDDEQEEKDYKNIQRRRR